MPFPTQMPGLDSLVQTFGVYNPETYDKARQTFDLASQFNQQNLLDQRQAYDQKQATNPLEIEKMKLENVGTGFSNEATRLGNVAKSRENTINEGIPIDTAVKAKMSGIVKQMSDDEITGLKNHAQKLALSTNPQERAQGLSIMTNLEDFVKEREKQKYETNRQLAVEGVKGQNAIELAKTQGALGRWDKKGGGKTIQDLRTKLQVEGDPQKRDALIRGGLAQAQLEGDTGAAAYFQGLFDANAPALATANTVKTAPTAARPDLNNMGVKTVAPPVVPPTVPVGNATTTPSAAPKHSLADLKKMYPGKSDADLKAAYKAKFGVDLK